MLVLALALAVLLLSGASGLKALLSLDLGSALCLRSSTSGCHLTLMKSGCLFAALKLLLLLLLVAMIGSLGSLNHVLLYGLEEGSSLLLLLLMALLLFDQVALTLQLLLTLELETSLLFSMSTTSSHLFLSLSFLPFLLCDGASSSNGYGAASSSFSLLAGVGVGGRESYCIVRVLVLKGLTEARRVWLPLEGARLAVPEGRRGGREVVDGHACVCAFGVWCRVSVSRARVCVRVCECVF